MEWSWLWIPATVIVLSKEQREELFEEILDNLHEIKVSILAELFEK